MARTINLDRALADLEEYLPDEIISRYQQTTFRSPSRLEESVSPFLRDGSVGFSINFYAEFLNDGTRFIRGQEFIQPVIDDDNGTIEDLLTISFNKDIDEAIEETIRGGGGIVA